MTKICSKCNQGKNVKEFSKQKASSDGLRSWCKKCDTNAELEYRHTKKGLVTLIYANQRRNSIARGHNMPTYSKKELQEWLYAQVEFHRLYDNWKRLDHQKEYSPSVDRKNDCLGYTIDNIQLMIWMQNNAKSHKCNRNGKYAQSKAVLMYEKDSSVPVLFISLSEAFRATGINHISCALNGKRKTAGKCKWKYFDESFKVYYNEGEI